MAEIRFLPVCSNCRNVITEEIDWREDADYIPYGNNLNIFDGFKTHHIVPSICPHCNCIFTKITMPAKLPFEEEIDYDRN